MLSQKYFDSYDAIACRKAPPLLFQSDFSETQSAVSQVQWCVLQLQGSLKIK